MITAKKIPGITRYVKRTGQNVDLKALHVPKPIVRTARKNRQVVEVVVAS
jgi:hypothetical protein